MKKSLLYFYFILSFSASAVNYDIVNLTNNEGLSNSSINIINQDSSGLIWIGTWDGLNVYNGWELNVYKPYPEVCQYHQIKLRTVANVDTAND